MSFYVSRGARLHYEAAGDGPPVLLVHGFTNFGQVWGPQIAALIYSGYRVITPDLAGHGMSAGADRITDVPALAQDMVALLDELGIERALICGLSLGGMIAQQMAVDHRDRTDAVVIAASRPSNEGTASAVESWIAEFEGPGGALGRLEKTYPLLLNDAYRDSASGEASLALWRLVLQGVKGTALAQVARGMLSFDLADRLSEVTAPALVIAGEQDRLIPVEQTRRIASLIPHAEYAEIAQGGHICAVDSAAAFNALLLRFAGDVFKSR